MYIVERMKLSLRKFYCRYGDLIEQYEISLSRMLNDILKLDQLQWLPNRSDFASILLPLYWIWPFPNYERFPWHSWNENDMTYTSNDFSQPTAIFQTLHIGFSLVLFMPPDRMIGGILFCNPQHPPPPFWGCVLLHLRSPKGGCCSILDDLSCSLSCLFVCLFVWLSVCLFSTLTFAITFE